jgi:hypothetical protein
MKIDPMKIELSSSVAIDFSTPIEIQTEGVSMPDGELVLRCEQTGKTIPAQKVGNAIIAILNNVRAGETKRFQLEAGSTPDTGVVVREAGSTLELQLPQGLFGEYHFGENVVRPYLWPLNGPGQTPMTRAFPMENAEGETTDHPHHTSLWTAFDEVNAVNNWHNADGHGFTQHQSFSDVENGPVCGGFTAQSVWQSCDRKPVLDETRTLRLYDVGEEIRLFDYEIIFAANYGEVTFNDTKEAGILAVRVATSMDGARGGVIENSAGGKGESECWGKQAAWCDYSGEVGGKTVGVAIFDHPQNPNFPTRWHVRDYGLFATNPFSTACFEAREATPFILPDGESVTFRYRILLHRGDAEAARVNDFYAAWCEPATAQKSV